MMIKDGTLAEDDRVELVEGLLVEKMGRNRPHVQAGKKGLRELSRIVPPGWHVAKEDPIVASPWSKPEPDLAVVRGEVDDYADRDVTAADVALVIEIAETSLVADRTEMLRVYASAGIPCYWILNLIEARSRSTRASTLSPVRIVRDPTAARTNLLIWSSPGKSSVRFRHATCCLEMEARVSS